jgi:hypothetical protein
VHILHRHPLAHAGQLAAALVTLDDGDLDLERGLAAAPVWRLTASLVVWVTTGLSLRRRPWRAFWGPRRDVRRAQLARSELTERVTRFGQLLPKATQLLHERQLLTDHRKGYRQSQSPGVRRVALDFF